MTWTIKDIEEQWGVTGVTPTEVEAFERVDRMLGRAWIESIRSRSGAPLQGAAPFLQVFSMGDRLRSLDYVGRGDKLIEKLKRQDPSAEAELTAIHILRNPHRAAEVELEPEVPTSGHIRLADFRIRLGDRPWTYVEVSQPNISEARQSLDVIIGRITRLVAEVQRPFALEVFFTREPAEEEVADLIKYIPRFCQDDRPRKEELGDLGLLILTDVPPGSIILYQDADGAGGPRLSGAGMVGGEPAQQAYRSPRAVRGWACRLIPCI